MPPVTPLTIARALEERLRRCPGVAGLDPCSRLVTVGPSHAVRGVRVGGPDAPEGLSLELVALRGARLPDAAAASRTVASEVKRELGASAGPVEVRITDLAEEPLPPQVTRDQPPLAPETAPPCEPDSSPATGSPGEPVRITLPDARGPVTLVITVETEGAR